MEWKYSQVEYQQLESSPLSEKKKKYVLDTAYLALEMTRNCCTSHCILLVIGPFSLQRNWEIWGMKDDGVKHQDIAAELQQLVVSDKAKHSVPFAGRHYQFLFQGKDICAQAYARLHAMSLDMLRSAAMHDPAAPLEDHHGAAAKAKATKHLNIVHKRGKWEHIKFLIQVGLFSFFVFISSFFSPFPLFFHFLTRSALQ
jgi:hypothetical protein